MKRRYLSALMVSTCGLWGVAANHAIESLHSWGFSYLQVILLASAIGIPAVILGVKATWRRAEAPRKALEQRYAEEDAQLLRAFEKAQKS